MAKDRVVWVVHWEYKEYGGYSYSVEPSYHLTFEEAEEYKSQREAQNQAFEDGYSYHGSEPSPEVVGKAQYKKIMASAKSAPPEK